MTGTENENKPKVDIISSLNHNIDRLETTLNSLTKELRKLKERKQELEKTKNKARNSTSKDNPEANNKTKEIVVEYDNSTESTSQKKKKSKKKFVDNGYKTVENEKAPTTNNDDYFTEIKDKRSRTISDSEEVSMEKVEIIKSITKKRKKENKANTDVNIERQNMHKNMSLCEDEAPSKKRKKDENVSSKSTNLETLSTHEHTAESTENLIKDLETKKPKQKNISDKIAEIENMDLKERLEIIKKLVNSITDQTIENGNKTQENNKNSEHPSNTVVENERNNQNETNPKRFQNPPNNFQSNYIPHKFHYNNFPNQNYSHRSLNNRFEYNNNSPKIFNNHEQNGRFLNNRYEKQKIFRGDKMNLIDELKSNSVKLEFTGANISDIPGYGERVNKF